MPSHEQLRAIESAPNIQIPKSRDFFDGKPEVGVGESFNQAVIKAQLLMGPDFYLTPTSFGEIMSSNWAGKKAGEAISEFDAAYEKFVLDKLGYNQDEIELITTSPEDTTSAPQTVEADRSRVRWVDKDTKQQQFDRAPAQSDRNVATTDTEHSDHPTHEILEESVAQELQVFLTQHPDLTVQTDPAAEALSKNLEAENDKLENIIAFNKFIAAHPEIESLRTEFLHDLEEYIRSHYT